MKRKNSKIVILISIFCIISISFIYSFQNLYKDYTVEKLRGWIIILIGMMLFVIISWIKIGNEVKSPYIIFILMGNLFWNGQYLLYILGCDSDKLSIIKSFNIEQINKGIIYTILFSLFFHIGAIIANLRIKENKKGQNENYEVIKRAMILVGTGMFIISFYPYMNELIQKTIKSLNEGYVSLYEIKQMGSIENILSYFKSFFIPSLIILYIAVKQNVKKYIEVLVVIVIVLGSFSGGRASSIIIMVIFGWIKLGQTIKVKKTNIIIMAVISFLCINVMIGLRDIRDIPDKDMNMIITAMREKKEDNVIQEVISEMGGSAFPLIKVMELQKEGENIKLGQSYISAGLAVVPSIFFGGFSFTKYANLAQWLMDRLQMGYGPGFSLVAEAYYNFSWILLSLVIIVGYFMIKPLLKYKMDINNPLFKAQTAIFLNVVIFSTRDSVYLIFRNYIYLIIIPSIIICFITKKIHGNAKEIGNEKKNIAVYRGNE